MINQPLSQPTGSLTDKRLTLTARGRLILLIMLFNLLLVTIVLLSIRNQEILAKTVHVETVNIQIQTRLAVVRHQATRIVYVTATFTPVPPTATLSPSPTPTFTETPRPPTDTPLPPTDTPTPSPTPTETPTPVPTVTATSTAAATATSVTKTQPTATATSTATYTPTPTTTPTHTSPPPPPPTDTPVPPTPTPTPFTAHTSPVARDDSAVTNEDIPVTTDVLANDTDLDGDLDPTSITVTSSPSNGSTVVNADHTVTYTPNGDFYGSDSFPYQVCDTLGACDTATVTVTVTAVNDAPVAAADAYSTNQDTPLAVPAPGVLGNDTDVDGDVLNAVPITNTSNGALALNADGSFAYTPNVGFAGADSFTYRANDSTVDSNTAAVTITVIDVPPAPPSNLRAAAGDSKIVLGWDPNTEVDLAGYRVYRSDGGAYSNIVTTTVTSHLDLTVANGTVYSYYVTAFDTGSNESLPSNIATAQPYNITPYTYTTNVTCTGTTVSNCNDAAGAPDGSAAQIDGTGVITLDFGAGTGFIDGPGYDMVFYEWPNPPGIWLDFVRIELSANGVNWYTVFEWDGDTPGDVTGTNIYNPYAIDPNGELENEQIPAGDLYNNTGIAIDIGAVQPPLPPPGYSFHLVRFTYPAGGSDAGEIDAVQRLN